MKVFFIAALVSFGLNAWACPNLEGHYTCADGEQEESMIITQREENGVTVYTVDGDVLIADGASHPMQDESFTGAYTAVCAAAAVNVNMAGVMTFDGGVQGDVNLDMAVTPTAEGLTTVLTGELKFGQDRYPIEQSSTCRKN